MTFGAPSSPLTSHLSPLQRLQVPLDVARALEAVEDQRILQAADQVLDDLRLHLVLRPPADERVEDLDQVQHVLMDLVAGGAAEVEEVEQLDLEGDALAADHDVV